MCIRDRVNGEPVDSDDRIAQVHDIAYENATEPEHVRAADRAAISSFAYDSAVNMNWHSTVGAVGLTAKYLFESAFGVQFPRQFDLASRKRASAASVEQEYSMSGSKTNLTDSMMSEN